MQNIVIFIVLLSFIGVYINTQQDIGGVEYSILSNSTKSNSTKSNKNTPTKTQNLELYAKIDTKPRNIPSNLSSNKMNNDESIYIKQYSGVQNTSDTPINNMNINLSNKTGQIVVKATSINNGKMSTYLAKDSLDNKFKKNGLHKINIRNAENLNRKDSSKRIENIFSKVKINNKDYQTFANFDHTKEETEGIKRVLSLKFTNESYKTNFQSLSKKNWDTKNTKYEVKNVNIRN